MERIPEPELMDDAEPALAYARAARQLGRSRAAVYRLIQKHGIALASR